LRRRKQAGDALEHERFRGDLAEHHLTAFLAESDFDVADSAIALEHCQHGVTLG
jgi:hypothetical protein